MLFRKKQKSVCGDEPLHVRLIERRKEKTKCGIFSKVSTSIERVKFIDIDAMKNKLFRAISLPLTRRVFPELFADKVVGVQPMTGHVGLAMAMRFIYREPGEEFNELV